MRYLLIILLFIGSQASGQRSPIEEFHAHNFTQTTGDSVYTFTDTDASNYIARVEAQGVTVRYFEKQAFDTYFAGLKADGLWTKIYDRGYLGWNNLNANAETFKGISDVTWSTVNFTLTDGAMGGNGGYGNLNITPSTALTLNSTHLSLYVTTGQSGNSARDIGSQNSINQALTMITGFSGSFYTDHYTTTTTTGRLQVANTNYTGYFIASRTSSTLLAGYRNGVSLGTNTNTSTVAALPSYSMHLFSHNNAGGASPVSGRAFSLWSTGAGLSATEAANDNTRTETLMDSLGHGVQ